jgi:hypothetical protein
MTVLRRVIVRLGIFVLVLFAVACIALFFAFRSANVTGWMQIELARRSGFDVRLRQVRFNLPFGVILDSVEVSKPGGFLLRTRWIAVTVNPLDLFSKTIHRLDVEEPTLQLDIQELGKSTDKTAGQIALRYLNIQDGTLVLKKGETTIFELPKLNLNAQNFNLGGKAGVLLRADVPQLNGEVETQMTGQPRDLAVEIVIRPKPSQSLFARQKPNATPAELVRLRAKLHAPENQNYDATIESTTHDLTLGTAKITGSLEARLEIDTDWKSAAFSARADVTDFPKSIYSNAVNLPNGELTANFAGVYSLPSKTLTLKSVEVTSPIGTGSGDGEFQFEPQARVANAKFTVRDIPLDNLKTLLPSPFNRWAVHGRGRLELESRGAFDALDVKGVVRGDAVQIRGGAINVAGLNVTAPFKWSNAALRVEAAKLDATKLAYGAQERWQGSAERLQAEASFELKADEPLKITGEFRAAGGKFSSPDNSRVGENLALSGLFEIDSHPTAKSIGVSGKFRVEAGELLWGKFFGDLKTPSPMLDLDADYLRDDDRLDCHPCNFNLANVGAIELNGAVEQVSGSPAFRLQARSTSFSPGGFFDFALRETFKRQYPLLDKLTVQGQMAFQLQLAGALDALAIDGELSLKAGELSTKLKDWQIGPITLELPVQIAQPQSNKRSIVTPRHGTLAIEKAVFRKQSFGPMTTTLSLSNNALQFHQPIHAALFGGEIAIAGLFWPDVIADPKRLSFSAEAKRVQLDELTDALNWHRFSGILTGSIPQVRSEGNLLRTSGEIRAEVFGGLVRIGKLEIENPFSTLASIKLDAILSGIELEQLSKTFEFGRISGILEGTIDDLVIIDNQPAQFRADLHSVDRGTEQRISVDALNKITVLSSGENAGALYGGLAGFFDSFRYSKLGFKASLNNDRLILRGVESGSDQEFLVVGSFLPPTVNVISHTQNIAFSELLRRLERIKSDKSDVK